MHVRVGVVDGRRIKTERMEEWIGSEPQEEGSGAEEGPALIDTSRCSSMVQEGFVSGAIAAKSSLPSSSFGETERLVTILKQQALHAQSRLSLTYFFV